MLHRGGGAGSHLASCLTNMKGVLVIRTSSNWMSKGTRWCAEEPGGVT